MAGLMPMMLGLNIDFVNGGYSIDSPTAMWWKPLATAVVFGLGISTVLTLLLTFVLLAARIWIEVFLAAILPRLRALRPGQAREDRALLRRTGKVRHAEILWDTGAAPAVAAPLVEATPPHVGSPPRHAAE